MISLCLYFLCRPVSKNLFAGGGLLELYSNLGGDLSFNVNHIVTMNIWNFGSAYNLSIDILYVWRY